MYKTFQQVDTVIFDMNGVIIDDEHVQEAAFRETLKNYGLILSSQEYLELFTGKTDRVGMEAMFAKYGVAVDIDKALADKADSYIKVFPIHKKAYPGVIETINTLSTKYKLAVASSSNRSEMDVILTGLGLMSSFTVNISGDDVTHGKPHPEPYLKALQGLNSLAARSVAIEDSRSGIRSAKDAGMYCIAITNTHPELELRHFGPDVIVSTYDDILDLLDMGHDLKSRVRHLPMFH